MRAPLQGTDACTPEIHVEGHPLALCTAKHPFNLRFTVFDSLRNSSTASRSKHGLRRENEDLRIQRNILQQQLASLTPPLHGASTNSPLGNMRYATPYTAGSHLPPAPEGHTILGCIEDHGGIQHCLSPVLWLSTTYGALYQLAES